MQLNFQSAYDSNTLNRSINHVALVKTNDLKIHNNQNPYKTPNLKEKLKSLQHWDQR